MIRHLLMLFGLLLWAAAVVQAQVPQKIPYQGVLYQSDGTPMADGTYSLTFSLYAVGSDQPVWQETQVVELQDGLFSVYLGAVVPLDLPFDQAYELGIAVDDNDELEPRLPLGSVPYALYAQKAKELSTDVVRSLNGAKGDLQLQAGQNVQITTAGPLITIDAQFPGGGEVPNPLDLVNDTASATITGRHTADGVGVRGVSKDGIGVHGVTEGDGYAGGFANSDSSITVEVAGINNALVGEKKFDPDEMMKLELLDYEAIFIGEHTYDKGKEKLRLSLLEGDRDGLGSFFTGLQLKRQKKNANGVFESKEVISFVDEDGLLNMHDYTSGFDMEITGFTIDPFKLTWDVIDGVYTTVKLAHQWGPAGKFSFIDTTYYTNDPFDLDPQAKNIGYIGDNEFAFRGVVEVEQSTAVEGVNKWNEHYGALGHREGAGVVGANKTGLEEATRRGYLGTDLAGVKGEARDSQGDSLRTEGRLGTGVDGVQGYGYCDDCIGVYGRSEEWVGVYGFVLDEYASGVTGYNPITEAYGELATAHTSVLGLADPTNSLARAGSFWGDVMVTGTLQKAGGSFRIDHPLDPANKYLSHSFVESPDMLNIYNGTVTLDEQGEAWVELPEWFEAINKDYRYQLTPIGAPMPELHVAEEIADNRFKIAGGVPGKRVSWQVTGVRDDPWARAHRIPVEEEKEGEERGRYLHPELYGQPIEKGLVWPHLQKRERLKARADRSGR